MSYDPEERAERWGYGDDSDDSDGRDSSEYGIGTDDGGLSGTDDSDDRDYSYQRDSTTVETTDDSDTYDDPRTDDEHTYVPDEQTPGSDDWESANDVSDDTEQYDDPSEVNDDDGGLSGGSDDSDDSGGDYDDPRTDDEHTYVPDEQTPDDWLFNPNDDGTVTDVHGIVGEAGEYLEESEFAEQYQELQNSGALPTVEAGPQVEQAREEIEHLLDENSGTSIGDLSTGTLAVVVAVTAGAGGVAYWQGWV